jgi:MFS family permease
MIVEWTYNGPVASAAEGALPMRLERSPALRYLDELRLLGPAVGLYLLVVGLVGFVVDGGVFAVLLNLYLLRIGYGPEQIGLVNAAGTLTFALASLPAGALGERLGSLRMIVVGIVMMLASTLLLPLADLLAPAARMPWLIATLALSYLGLAFFFVNTAPFLLGAVAPARRTQVFGLQTALLSLAAFLGSLVGGALPPLFAELLGLELSAAAPFRYALMLSSLALFAALVAVRAIRPAAPSGPETGSAASLIGPVAGSLLGLLFLIALVRLLQVAGVAATTTFFNVYLDAELLLPTAQIGAIIATGRLLGVPAALATSWLTDRFGKPGVVIASTLASAAAILPLALIPRWEAAAISFVGLVGLSWIRYSSSIVYMLELVPPGRRATVSGLSETAGGICFTLITFGGGYMIVLLGYRALFLTAAAVTALSALVFWLAFRGREPYAES